MSNTKQPSTPAELSFYEVKLESLQEILFGIGGIARALHNALNSPPDWWDDYVHGGQLSALAALYLAASEHLEFLLEPARGEPAEQETGRGVDSDSHRE